MGYELELTPRDTASVLDAQRLNPKPARDYKLHMPTIALSLPLTVKEKGILMLRIYIFQVELARTFFQKIYKMILYHSIKRLFLFCL